MKAKEAGLDPNAESEETSVISSSVRRGTFSDAILYVTMLNLMDSAQEKCSNQVKVLKRRILFRVAGVNIMQGKKACPFSNVRPRPEYKCAFL